MEFWILFGYECAHAHLAVSLSAVSATDLYKDCCNSERNPDNSQKYLSQLMFQQFYANKKTCFESKEHSSN